MWSCGLSLPGCSGGLLGALGASDFNMMRVGDSAQTVVSLAVKHLDLEFAPEEAEI